LDIEDVRVQTIERMRRIFVLVLLAALFVYHIDYSWPRHTVLWLRNLGGKFGLSSDADGPYVLLAGIRAVFVAAATLSFAAKHPFPREGATCGHALSTPNSSDGRALKATPSRNLRPAEQRDRVAIGWSPLPLQRCACSNQLSWLVNAFATQCTLLQMVIFIVRLTSLPQFPCYG
jgi:hypothetical protein